MHLNPYGQDAVCLMADLANSPPTSLDDLVKRCLDAGFVMDMPVVEEDLTVTLDLVDRWCEIVDTSDEKRRAELVNRLLAETAAHPRLTDHGGTGWHVHYRDQGLPLGKVLRALGAVGTALHLAGRGMSRLGRCAREGCGLVYVDVSRGGRQRYCSPRCSNRDAVRRHRARRAPGVA
ncbi:CGNR zinc finger domain-containing protein [Sphaerisporangium fuscum]|uniref:CGNR zinc finger domain-containing protein n=1 Tax=Sphaerisporangium fuscum TaxID=2835868 RepID=UPI001BDD0C2C|nr:CGNR zinc finger domain-containing protein [Sphaerisporangium fuscum]